MTYRSGSLDRGSNLSGGLGNGSNNLGRDGGSLLDDGGDGLSGGNNDLDTKSSQGLQVGRESWLAIGNSARARNFFRGGVCELGPEPT